MTCSGCKSPSACTETCQVFASEQILRERVLRAVAAMPRCQLTTTIPMRELERFAAVLLAQNAWTALTDEDRTVAFNSMPDMLDGFLKTWGWLHFAKAIEAKCREKNERHSPESEA